MPLIAVVTLSIFAIAAITVLSRQSATGYGSGDVDGGSTVSDKVAKNYVTVKVAGQDVQVDGQTGQIKPLTPQEAERLAQGLKQMIHPSAEGLVQVQHPDGSVSMDLEDRFQNVTVARINQDGTVTQSCVDNPQAAGAFFGIDPKLIEHRPKAK